MSLWAAALPWTTVSADSVLRAKVALSFGRETEKKGTMGENLYKTVSEKNNMLIFAVLISLSCHTGSTGHPRQACFYKEQTISKKCRSITETFWFATLWLFQSVLDQLFIADSFRFAHQTGQINAKLIY